MAFARKDNLNEHLKRVHPQEITSNIAEAPISDSGHVATEPQDDDSEMEDGDKVGLKDADIEIGVSPQKVLLEAKLRELESQRAKVDGDIAWVKEVLSFM
jgi:hypothetical protein